ncbi:protein SENESCENCE-ASSOCIATED GENE 21, mitochondrial-like [Lycium ferocissimum]|uniref:protein SENESCENCE-ASSOCIATED GENE 21, mitochondrial-like n=1 Tax=Lycium ferocissimum TaxID=112874 RepID=UPI0028162F93|nr:protein SENESCENCE-ASSOCIATED GENE 21, mitochondrial-like [Lycium ferocissimum]
MPRVPFSSVLLLNLRRGYTVAVENLKERTVACNSSKVAKSSSSSSSSSSIEKGVEKEIYWMRDPKTGNWIPETHFNTIDAAELRDKFLPTSRKFTMPNA